MRDKGFGISIQQRSDQRVAAARIAEEKAKPLAIIEEVRVLCHKAVNLPRLSFKP